MRTAFLILLISANIWAQDCVECGSGRSPAVVNSVETAMRDVASVVDKSVLSSARSLMCSAIESNYVGDHRRAIKYLEENNLEFADIYFDHLNCNDGDIGFYIFTSVHMTVAKAEYFVRYLKFREQKTGRQFLDGVLNKVLQNPAFTVRGPQTLVDYWMYNYDSFVRLEKDYGEDYSAIKRNILDLVDFFRSQGAKSLAELK